jgi:hypothetical protein
MRACSLHLLPVERRALAWLALLAGSFVAVTAIGITAAFAVWAATAEDYDYIDPAWAWVLAMAVLAAGVTALGVRLGRRGLRARHGEPGFGFGRGLVVTYGVWTAWALVADVFLGGFVLYAFPFVFAAVIAALLLSRAVVALRALLDSRR